MLPSRSDLLPKPAKLHESTLANGMLLLHECETDAPFVSFRLTSRIGASIDPRELAGSYNLSAGLMEAGTKSHTEDEIALQFESRGASFDIDVSKDLLTLTLISLTDRFEEDLSLLMEIITTPVFPDTIFEREREMVRMAILEREDDPISSTIRQFREDLWGTHPYGVSAMGTLETVDRLECAQVADAVWPGLQPSKMVGALVGGTEKQRGQLADRLGAYQARTTGETPRIGPTPSNGHPLEPVLMERDREASCVIVGFHAPAVTGPAAIPFRVIDGILGGAMDSRLFTLIREERGLAYQVGSSFVSGREGGYLAMYALTMPDHVDEVVELGQSAFQEIVEEPIPEDELDRTIRYLLGTNLMALETRSARSSEYSILEALGLGYGATYERSQQIAQVTPQAIQEAAQQYLQNPLTVISGPLAKASE